MISARHFLLIQLIAFPFLAKGQSLSWKADSVTIFYLVQLPERHFGKFDTLMNHHTDINMEDSINNSTAEYLIIDETFCYATNVFTTDIYKKSDSAETDPLFANFSKEMKNSKPVEVLDYAKWNWSEHDRKCRKKHNYKEECKAEWESTYRILTMINRKTGEIIVSLQYPPKKAHCHFIYAGGGKC